MAPRDRVCALAALTALALLTGCGGATSSTTAPPLTGTVSTPAARTSTGSTSGALSPTRPPSAPKRDPGTLPQTATRPATRAAFDAQMHTLWAAIVAGSPRLGRQVYFPEAAYRQLKAIPDPTSDYIYRLRAFFDLDLAAYRAHVGPTPTRARLVAIEADPAFAAWIPAGACENAVGYWHLPGTRLVYAVAGSRYSFRVSSLISWRGVWYVIHLGPNPRPVNVGTVDDPQIGPGVPGPSGGC
jgi:hypothetical protein